MTKAHKEFFKQVQDLCKRHMKEGDDSTAARLELTLLVAKTLKEVFPKFLSIIGKTNADNVLGFGVIDYDSNYEIEQYGYSKEEVKVFDRIQVILSECSLFQPFVGWGDDEEHTKVDHKAVCYMKNQGFDVLVHIETEDEDDEFEDAYAQVYVSLGDAVIRL